MKFIGIVFFGAILLHLLVTDGEFCSIAGEDLQKRTLAMRQNSMLVPQVAADQIYTNILKAIIDRPGLKQIAFLYLHGIDATINYGNENLKKKIKNKKLGASLEPGEQIERPEVWPIKDPKNTNLLIAVPDKKDQRRPGNLGHAEHKLLGQLESLREGFAATSDTDAVCPEYVILGTRYRPCRACAQDYVQAKQNFAQGKCPNTDFYLYITGTYAPGTDFSWQWQDIETLITSASIILFPYPTIRPPPVRARPHHF
jgi:hypothetical protein